MHKLMNRPDRIVWHQGGYNGYYYKYPKVCLPDDVVAKSGLTDKDDLEFIARKGEIVIRRMR